MQFILKILVVRNQISITSNHILIKDKKFLEYTISQNTILSMVKYNSFSLGKVYAGRQSAD